MNRFSILREEPGSNELYEVGPWGGDTKYLQETLEERLDQEIYDIVKWLDPTSAERKLRLLTIARFSRVIEQRFPGCYVIPQGSSATQTFLPTSDIDLIVMNLPSGEDPVQVLRLMSKVFQKSKMVNHVLVIGHAHVPIAKLVERPFGFHIDLCASNINGALNIERMGNIMTKHPLFRTVLMFFKLFVWAYGIDDPAKGGFGSNLLMNLVHFGFQSRPDISSPGEMVLYLFDVIANRINFFLTGVTTVGGGALVSKLKRDLLTDQCPNALIFEDPQFHGNHIGVRTSSIDDFVIACSNALQVMKLRDHNRISPVSSFMPELTGMISRRDELARFARLLDGPVKYFAAAADAVPTFIKSMDRDCSKNQKQDKTWTGAKTIVVVKKKNKKQLAQKPKDRDEWDDFLVKAMTKQHRKEQKKEDKKKREKEKRQEARQAQANFHMMWIKAQNRAKQLQRQNTERRRDFRRNKSPSRRQ